MWRDVLNERGWRLADNETPPLAAHLVTARCGYTHHGIYVGNGNVVHYAGLARSWLSGPVEEVSLADFACGREIRVRVCRNPQFDPSEIVCRARSRIGENRYRILANNCEHFCEWCLRGRNRSSQVEHLRNWPRHIGIAMLNVIAPMLLSLREALWNCSWSHWARA